MERNWAPSSTLPIDRHPLRVAPKVSNVLFHPSQRLDLVEESNIKISIGRISQLRDAKEAKGWEAVVYWNDDEVGALVDPMLERKALRVAEDVAWLIWDYWYFGGLSWCLPPPWI